MNIVIRILKKNRLFLYGGTYLKMFGGVLYARALLLFSGGGTNLLNIVQCTDSPTPQHTDFHWVPIT